MSSVLSHMALEIQGYIDWTSIALRSIFDVITTTGGLLLHSTVFILNSVRVSVSNLFVGACIFVNDFWLFLWDLYLLVDELLSFLSQGMNHLVQSVATTLLLFFDIVDGSNHALYALIETVSSLVLTVLFGTKSLFILVGDGTLYLLQLGPSIVVSLYAAIISLTGWVVCQLWKYFSSFACGVVTVLTSLHLELANIPPSSLLGVLLAFIIAVVVRCYLRSISWTALRQNSRTLVENWLLERRRANRSNASHQLNESSSSIDDDPLAGSSVSFSPSASSSPAKPVASTAMSRFSKSHLLRQLELEREDKLCVICQDQNKCVILLPCRHYCLCQNCMQRLVETDPICPICRQFVFDNLKIYG